MPLTSAPPSSHRRQPAAGWRPVALIVLLALALASIGNVAWWRGLDGAGAIQGGRGVGFALLLGVGMAGLFVALQALFAWPRIWRWGAALLVLLTAAATHFMLAYGIVIDPTMMVNVAQTDPREARDLLGLKFALTFGLGGLLPAWWIVSRRVAWPGGWRAQVLRNLGLLLAGLALAIGALAAVYQPMAATMRNHKQLRYLLTPLNVLYAGANVATASWRVKDTRLRPAGLDASLAARTAGAQAPLIVLVVGETARSASWQLDGYARPTTPKLAARLARGAEGGLSHFPRVEACGTSTAASLPCMFSLLGREAYEDRDGPHENVLDVVQRAGMAVLWLDNQAGCKGVCDRVGQATTATLPAGVAMPAGVCDGGECRDEALLVGLDQRLAALPPAAREKGTVLVLHMMGSHGPAYHKRSAGAQKVFQPECRTATLQDCERQQVVNAYDNSLVATDAVLDGLIQWLERHAATQPTALVYVSDHGESLGEANVYLHGLPRAIAPREQLEVPWVNWWSQPFAQQNGLDRGCVESVKAGSLTHDHLPHTLLGLAGVATTDYRPAWDALAHCRSRSATAR